MFTIKKELLHKLLTGALLLSIGLSTTLTAALPVYAEEANKTEEAEETTSSYDNVSNNVAGISDINLRNSYKASSAYDVGMQYLVTYSILKGTYLEGSDDYGDIYSTDVSADSYSSNVSKNISSKVKTGAQEIIAAAKNSEPTIDTETPTDDAENSTSEKDVLIAELAEKATNAYIKKINTFYVISADDLKVDFHNAKNDGPPTSLLRTAKSKELTPSKEASDAMKQALTVYFKAKLDTAGDLKALEEAIILTETEFKKGVFNSGGSDSYNYFTIYGANPKIGPDHKWADATVETLEKIKLTTGFSKIYNYSLRSTNPKVDFKDRVKEQKIVHAYTLNAHAEPKVENTALKKVGTTLNDEEDVITKIGELEAAKGLKDLADNPDTGGVRTLSWTPLVPYYDKKLMDNSDYDKFKKALEEEGIVVGESSGGLISLDQNSKTRAVQLGDLFFKNGKNASHVILGPSSGENTKDYIKLSMGGLDTEAALSKSSIGNFLGVKVNNRWIRSDIFETLVTSDLAGDSVTRGTMRAITASGKYSNLKGNETALGIDNYGNIITGETGEIVIPYWHNTMFLDNGNVLSENDGSKAYVTHPVYASKAASSKDLTKLLDEMLKTAVPKELDVTVENIKTSGLVSDTSGINNSVTAVQTLLKTANGDITSKRLSDLMAGKTLDKEETLQVLAMLITAGTQKSVKTWNEKYWDLAISSGSAYVGLSSAGFITGGTDDSDEIARWTAASIIQKIGLLFDWGFAETIRITLADMMVNFYNSSFASTGLTNIFYTPNVTEADAWTDMLEPLGLLLLAFTPIYILFMVFKVNRGTATAKDIIKQFVMLALIFLIPIVGYGAFTDMLLNKPAEWILGNQLKQTVVLDYYLDKQQANASEDDSWAQLFGDSNLDNKLRTADNYILTFYTTTDKDGFQIDDPNNETNMIDEIRTEALTRGADWNKGKLVSVNVSMFDLYNWATEQNKAYDDEQSESTLFEWLGSKYPDDYKGVSDFDEYYTNTNTIFDTPNNAGGVLTSSTTGENITASELFKRLHRQGRKNTNGDTYDLKTGLDSLTEVMNLFVQGQKEYYSGDTAYYVPTVDDLHAVMRDLSMTGSTRKVAFGSNEYSKFTRSIMDGNSDTNYSLSIPVNIPKPVNDIFGVYDTVSDLNPYLASGRGGGLDKESIEKMTYDINYDVLTQLANVYSLIPNSTNISTGNVDMSSALQMATVTEIFFQLNDEMGFKNFPKAYAPGTVSTDNYLKMIFIPFIEYELSQANFANSEVMSNNVAEYLSGRENSAVLLLFIISTLCLAIYGLFMMAIFYGFMLVLTLYSFILNYIIKNNYKNKSWLGVLGIYTVLGLVKFGLVLVWYVMTTILNYQYTQYSGATYPFVMIHALVIIAYLFFVSKFVIVKLFSAVYKDKENMGGEAFSSGLSKMKDVVTAKTSISRGRNRPMGDVAGNAKRKFGNMATGSGKFARGAGKVGKFGLMGVAGAGLLGAMGGAKVAGKIKNSDNAAIQTIKSKISENKASYNESKFGQTTQAVGRGVRNAGRGIGSAGRGARSFGYTIAHPFQAFNNKKNDNRAMNYKNNAQKSIFNKNMSVLGNIPKAVNGVAATAVSAADTAGKIYGAKEAATATMFTLGTAAAAKVFASGLESAGRLVRTEGTNVFVESTSEDLTTVEGRSSLVDNGVTSIQNQADKYSYQVSDTSLKGLGKQTPVLYGQAPNGAFNLLFSDKNGLDTRYYEKMTENKEFREHFTVDPSTVQTYADGRIKPESQIKVIPKNSTLTKSKAQNIFQSLYKEDNNFREENNYRSRKGGDYKALDLSGIPVAERTEYLKEAPKGVMLNDTGIIYQSDNKDQRNYVSNLKQQIQEKTKENKDTLSRDRDSIINYVKEGEGHGVPTQTFNSKDDVLVNQLFGNKISEHSVTFNTGDKNDTEQITSYISSIQKLENVTNDDRQSYNTAQSIMHKKGVQVLQSEGPKNSIEKSINFLSNKHSVNNTTALNSIVETKESIDRDLSKGAITPKEADAHYNQLFQSSLNLASDSNHINDLLRENAAKVDIEAIDKFNNAKRVMESKYKISPNDIDKIKWDDESMAEYKDAFGGINKFKVEDNIGRIESKDTVKADKVSKLVEKATSKSFKEKKYDTGYKPQTDKKDDIEKPKDVFQKVKSKSSEMRKKVMNLKD